MGVVDGACRRLPAAPGHPDDQPRSAIIKRYREARLRALVHLHLESQRAAGVRGPRSGWRFLRGPRVGTGSAVAPGRAAARGGSAIAVGSGANVASEAGQVADVD